MKKVLLPIFIHGHGGVGKTSLAHRFCYGTFSDYDPTIENCFRKEITVEDSIYALNIVDVSGIGEFRTNFDNIIRKAKGILFVYSITSKDTFLYVTRLLEKISSIKRESSYPLVLVANKCDLGGEGQREVPVQEGQDLAKKFNCLFYESSALLDINVNEAFLKLGNLVVFNSLVGGEPILVSIVIAVSKSLDVKSCRA